MKKKNSLKITISIYLLIYAAALVALAALFQTVLLQPMYESSKVKEIKRISDEVINDIKNDGDINDWYEILYDASAEEDVCMRMIYDQFDLLSGNMGCMIFRMNEYEILDQVSKAQENGNAYLQEFDRLRPDSRQRDMKDIVYTRIVDVNGKQAILLTNTTISTVNATVNTLGRQLWYFASIALLGVLLLVYFMNKYIARPITAINDAAKSLPQGEYTIEEKTNQYQEVQELNETLNQAAFDIRKADQAKRDLIANVSHDLRTPLTMISGYGEMMKDLPGEKTDENCQVIIDEAHRLTNLVNDLLDLSKLQNNQIVLEKTDFNLSQLLQNECHKYDVYTIQDGYSIDYEVEEDLMVHADEARIAQVIHNFMSNAINYSQEDKYIQVRLFKKDKNAHIEIEDHGDGINEEQLKDIWDRYYKVDQKHVRFSSGSGIGLSIVKEILDLHQSPYGVNSEVGKGSTFWFELPLIETE